MYYDMKNSGARIRQLRIKSGLTQEKIANALNIDQSYYGRIESGKKGCFVNLFIQLSALFGVSLDYLILGKYLGDLPVGADIAQIKTDVGRLIDCLERFRLAL